MHTRHVCAHQARVRTHIFMFVFIQLAVEVNSQRLQKAMDREKEPITPIPGSIRPIYSKHRIEVLFWGVRDLKKLQFTAVTRPRIDVECAGHVISSTPLLDANKNPNFT